MVAAQVPQPVGMYAELRSDVILELQQKLSPIIIDRISSVGELLPNPLSNHTLDRILIMKRLLCRYSLLPKL